MVRGFIGGDSPDLFKRFKQRRQERQRTVSDKRCEITGKFTRSVIREDFHKSSHLAQAHLYL